jgi:hypothetical protein
MVKVVPKNDDIRNLLKHPTAGPFRSEGSSDWPDDSFTHRRIQDGDVTIEEPPPPPEAAPEEAVPEPKEDPPVKEGRRSKSY